MIYTERLLSSQILITHIAKRVTSLEKMLCLPLSLKNEKPQACEQLGPLLAGLRF